MSYYYGNDISLGTDRITGEQIPFNRMDRARHTCIFGSSRTGKSKLVEHMIRQDILRWPEDHCPVVLLDPHGTLYKNLTAFVVAENFKEWPIVPIDLGRGDLIVSYNLLRRRKGIDPSVVCRSFVDSILYAWGQMNKDQTARLATWLHTLLMLSYEREHTLSEALQVIANPELRRLMAADVQDLVARSALQSAEHLTERDFQERVESTMYRINRFLSGEILRATFCQTGESLDLGRVLSKGQILLANLSIEGGRIHPEDAAAFGSVLLSDLWNAAHARGKKEEGEIPPCYFYIDEFQNFVGPTIAKGLAEASGFGLNLNLISQWPSQLLLHGGDVGRLVLDSVLTNAQNQVLFRLQHPDDLDMMTRMVFRQAIDPMRVKDEITSPVVVGHELRYEKGFNRSWSESLTRLQGWSHAEALGSTRGNSHTLTAGSQATAGVSDGHSQGTSTGRVETKGKNESNTLAATRSRNETESHGIENSETNNTNWAKGDTNSSSRSGATSHDRSQSHDLAKRAGQKFQNELGAYWAGAIDEEEEDKFKRKWATQVSITEGEVQNESEESGRSATVSAGGGRGITSGTNNSRSTGVGDAESLSKTSGQNSAESHSLTNQQNHTRTNQASFGNSLAEAWAFTESESEQVIDTVSGSLALAEGSTEGESLVPMLVPILEERVTSRQFKTVDEQVFEMSKLIDGQRVRQCFIRRASDDVPHPAFTPAIEHPLTTPELAKRAITRRVKRLPFCLPFDQADKNVRDRQSQLLGSLRAPRRDDEIRSLRRPIKPKAGTPRPPRKAED